MRLPTLDVNTDGTWQHKRKLHVFLQHLAGVLCAADLDDFQGFPREALFSQSRRDIVCMEYSEPLLGCLAVFLFDCRDSVVKSLIGADGLLKCFHCRLLRVA